MVRDIRHWFHLFALLFFTASLLLAGCGDSEPAGPGDPNDEECEIDCEIGQSECTDDGAVQVCTTLDGCPAWTESSECDDGEICEQGQCIDDPEDCEVDCEIGESQCRGDGVEYCVESQGCPDWTEPIACEGDQSCSGGACVTECDDECTPGDRSCEDTGSYRVCEYDADGCGVWADPTECSEFELCSAGQCVSDCDDACDQGDTTCDGDGFQVCQLQETGCLDWSDSLECPDNTVCDGGECTQDCTDQCSDEGETVCDGDGGVQICQEGADGCLDWSSTVTCSDGSVCSDGACIGDDDDCTDACTGGATICGADTDLLACEMQPTGCYDWSAEDCDSGEICDDGDCIEECTDQCSGGATQCGSDGIQLCQQQADGCYDWSDSIDCPDNTACDDGQCVSDCTDQCDNEGDTTCDGTTAFQVCQYQADGCLDWAASLSCPDATECDDGECVADCPDECTAGDTTCDGDSVQVCHEDANGCTSWTDSVDCSDGLTCSDGQCVEDCSDQCTDGATRCAGNGIELCEEQTNGCLDWSGPFGCPDNSQCDGGECVSLDEDDCSPDNPDGLCPEGEICDDGECIDENCSSENPDGFCPAGEICDGGECIDDPMCNCADDEVCVDGQCHPEEDECSTANPDGLCDSGFDCIEGECISDNACDADNPGGVCPTGQWCDGGDCVEIDDDGLCSDFNDCTATWFDYDYNLCLTEPVNNPCDDGNACTDNWCDGGECQADDIDGCVQPPELDAFPSRIDDSSITITGTKPAGSGIEVNGTEVVSENQETDWEFNPSLNAGNNSYDIRWFDGDDESEIQTIDIYYDNEAPETTVTPDGGTFLDGITVQVTTDQPADVHYTTDGTTPTSSSESFRSIRQFRIFEPTELRFRARDDAGNWEDEVTEASFDITSYANGWADGPELWDDLRDAASATIDTTFYVAGGTSNDSAQADAKGWDPDGEQWSALPSLSPGRAEASMVSLNDELYLIGGQNDGTVFNHITHIDPGADSPAWDDLQGMPTDRYGHEAIAFDGDIYVFGGRDNNDDVVDILEVYDPDDNTWSNQYEQLPVERYDFEAVLHDELIYLFGGVDASGDPLDVVDVYDPADDSWSTTEPMPTSRSAPAAGVIEGTNAYNASHRSVILVAGGVDENGDPTPVVEEYDPDTDSWTVRTPMHQARFAAASAAFDVPYDPGFQKRQLWIAGGETVDGEVDDITTYIHDLEYKRRLSELPEPRYDHSAASWNDRIYIVAGRHEGNHQSSWAFDPETGSYIDMPDLPQIQNGLGTAALGKYVYAIGGESEFGTAIGDVWALDPVEQTWSQKASMSSRKHPAVTVVDDRIYAIGGYSNGTRQSVEVYDPDEDNWSSGPSLNDARTAAMATVHQGDLYVLGGVDNDGDFVTSVERLSEGAGSWEVVSGVSIEAAHGAAFSLGDDILAVLGGRENNRGMMWLYDLDEDTVDDRTTAIHELVDRAATTFHHGRLYMFGGNTDFDDPGPAGESTTRKFHLHGCVDNSTAVMPGWCTGISPENLYLVDYADGLDGSNSWNWRGYRFRVASPKMVTALYGGGTSSFPVGLYEADGDTPTDVLADGTASGRRSRIDLSNPVVLEPGNDYIIAQGRSGSGDHYRLETISGSAIESLHYIDSWNPSHPTGSLNFGGTGGASSIIGSTGSSNNIRPDMGIGFD